MLLILLPALLLSCRGKEADADAGPAPEVLMQVGDSTLTRAMVTARIPAGISPADSARLFDAIVEEWLERNMLADVAASNIPDIDHIDRMVEQYRRQLLVSEYRRLMAGEYSVKVTEDSVRARYEREPEIYTLTTPIIKGIYVKLPADAPQLAEVRGWVNKATPEAIDELENYGLRGAMEYDYFADQWVAWDEIARRIPARLDSPSAVSSQGRTLEATVDGITYLVHISEAMAAGERMPLDFARPAIEQLIAEQMRESYDHRLLRDIYLQQVDSRRIHPGTYVPLRYRDVSDK